MPRYFFHLRGAVPERDLEGQVLPDDEAAWREATTFAGALFNEIDGRYRPGQDWSLEVADAANRPIFSISISSTRMR
ncbi:DUF6894 family protein [Bradyrhizobium sp. DASA03076]|uniref:DUF6894 family protein n=1 Tax=Bradyrhizobium TaxID=374 RepID=UPI003D317E52